MRYMRRRRRSRIRGCERKGLEVRRIDFVLVLWDAHFLEETHHETLAILDAGAVVVFELVGVDSVG